MLEWFALQPTSHTVIIQTLYSEGWFLNHHHCKGVFRPKTERHCRPISCFKTTWIRRGDDPVGPLLQHTENLASNYINLYSTSWDVFIPIALFIIVNVIHLGILNGGHGERLWANEVKYVWRKSLSSSKQLHFITHMGTINDVISQHISCCSSPTREKMEPAKHFIPWFYVDFIIPQWLVKMTEM